MKTEREIKEERLCNASEVRIPQDEDLRAVALDPRPRPTPALEAFRAALAWRAGRRCGCVMVVGGPRGLGKSAGLAWALLAAAERTSALYLQAPVVGATPRNGFSTSEEAWEEWLSVGVLGLDDVGTEGGDPEAVASLLWQRYDRGLRTLVTANLARAVFAERYLRGAIGARLADRLINAQGRAGGDGGLGWFVGVSGESLRNPEVRAKLPPAPSPASAQPARAPIRPMSPADQAVVDFAAGRPLTDAQRALLDSPDLAPEQRAVVADMRRFFAGAPS